MVSRLEGDDGSPRQDRARLSGDIVSMQPFKRGGRDDRKEGKESSKE